MDRPPATLIRRPAVVTIDLHRGHLDPEVATMPLDGAAAAALLEVVVPALARLRDVGVPIVHVVTSYRDASEITSNPLLVDRRLRRARGRGRGWRRTTSTTGQGSS